MIIHRWCSDLPAGISAALDGLEHASQYPLGDHASFRVAQGPDHLAFMRGLGRSMLFLAEDGGTIVGCLQACVRDMRCAGSSASIAYFGGLKLARRYRNGLVLHHLLRSVEAWTRESCVAAYGVVMDGTEAKPDAYTGRLGISAFRPVAQVDVLTIHAPPRQVDPAWLCDAPEGEALFKRLHGGYAASGSESGITSSTIVPFWLRHPDRTACCRLQDTRRSKRLYVGERELRNLHCSRFVYRDRVSAVDLLKVAAGEAAHLDHDGVFAVVPAQEAPYFIEHSSAISAPATVFGAGHLPDGFHLDSAEI